MTTQTLYDTDFYAWSQEQAHLLQRQDFAHLDLTNLIEEIEDMGISQHHQLENRLIVLIAHLLKWQYQPGQRSRSWEATLLNQRYSLERLLRKNPSLRRRIPESIEAAYPEAVVSAWAETNLDRQTFPPTCPYTQQQIFDDTFFPTS